MHVTIINKEDSLIQSNTTTKNLITIVHLEGQDLIIKQGIMFLI